MLRKKKASGSESLAPSRKDRKKAQKMARVQDTVIGGMTVVDGHVRTEGGLRLDGTVIGDVVAAGDLVIGPGARIQGSVSARDVTAGGTVQGDIRAEGLLVVQATARLNGKITMNRLVVDEGAVFRGECDMPMPEGESNG